MEINDFSMSVGLAPDFVASPPLDSIVALAPNSIAGPDPGFVAGLIPGSVIVLAPGAVAGCVVLVVIDPKTTFFYSKQITAEDYTSFKLYIKGTI